MLSVNTIGLRWLQAAAMALQIGGIEEIEQIEIQFPEYGIRNVNGEQLLACQDVMYVGLRNTGHAGEAAFADFSAADFMTKAVDQPYMEFRKSKHNNHPGYSPEE